MKFIVYYCKNNDYSDKCFEAKVDKRILHHVNGKKLEVECYFSPEIKGHSNDRFNTMFLDRNEEVNEFDRKYFTKASWIERFKLRKQFGLFWVQKEPLAVIAIIISILAAAVPIAIEVIKMKQSPK